MKMTMSAEGTEEIRKLLEGIAEKASGVAARGLYDGAGTMAEGINAGVDGIKTEEFHYTVFGQRMPSPEEKEILKSAAGIARFKRADGEVNTSVGFGNAGYAMIKGRRKPIPLIANAINSGTSFMKKQAFFRRAYNRNKGKAEEAIIQTIESEIDKMTGGNKA